MDWFKKDRSSAVYAKIVQRCDQTNQTMPGCISFKRRGRELHRSLWFLQSPGAPQAGKIKWRAGKWIWITCTNACQVLPFKE